LLSFVSFLKVDNMLKRYHVYNLEITWYTLKVKLT
jgi:hypothetical protein